VLDSISVLLSLLESILTARVFQSVLMEGYNVDNAANTGIDCFIPFMPQLHAAVRAACRDTSFTPEVFL
jgi:hypothetical protein